MIREIKLYFTVKKIVKESEMIQQILTWLNGKKTYLAALGWVVYKVGSGSGWWPENHNIETLLIGSGAVALREGIKKAEKP